MPDIYLQRRSFSHFEFLSVQQIICCSTVWSGKTQQNIQKLQRLQNLASRILTGKRKYNHISTTIRDLGCLPITNMLQLRDQVTMVFEILNGLAASYLDRFNIHSQNTRQKNHLDITLGEPQMRRDNFCFRRNSVME